MNISTVEISENLDHRVHSMTAESERENGYITLKEASERFGYAPDYIGQLIRKGKIEGKQVYANVAWVTTVEAMEAYIAGEKERKRREEDRPLLDRLMQKLLAPRASRLVRSTLAFVTGCLLLLLLLLFYMLSVAVDHRLSRERAARIHAEFPALAEEAAMLADRAPDETLFAHPAPRHGE